MEAPVGVRMAEEDLIEGIKELEDGSKMFEPDLNEESVSDKKPKHLIFELGNKLQRMVSNSELAFVFSVHNFLVLSNLF
jgi:hypothetical protein